MKIGRPSLTLDFTMLCVAILLGCAIFMGVALYKQEQHHNREHLLLHSETVLANLVQAIQLAGNDTRWIQSHVVGVATGAGIIQIVIFDDNFFVRFASDPRKRGTIMSEIVELGDIGESSMTVMRDRETGKEFLRLLQPMDSLFINRDSCGAALIDVSFYDPVVTVPHLGWEHLLLIWLAVSFLAVAAIYYFIGRRVIQVVSDLNAGAGRIAKGDFEKKIAVHSTDELGQLARKFNQMAGELSRSVVSKNYFDQIIRSMGDSLVVVEAAGSINLVNQATLDLLGCSEEELLGTDVFKFIRYPLIKADSSGPENILALRGEHELVYLAKSGREIPVMFFGSLLTAPEDGGEQMVFVASDISSQKRAAAEIKEMNETLMVANQELKETQIQLLQAAKLAALGELATGVAHEVNQPLHIISLSADFGLRCLKKGDLKEAEARFAKIQPQIKRASLIIDHLRTFGRATDEKDLRNHKVNQIIESSFRMFNEQFRLLNIQIDKELAQGLPLVNCNAIQIEQVLSNILINARDAMADAHEKKITISSSQENDMVVIKVADSGCGISESVRESIFDPFFTTKEIGMGTGLGLSISYGIIKDHDGTIEVESREGQGTAFKIKLPFIKG